MSVLNVCDNYCVEAHRLMQSVVSQACHLNLSVRVSDPHAFVFVSVYVWLNLCVCVCVCTHA